MENIYEDVDIYRNKSEHIKRGLSVGDRVISICTGLKGIVTKFYVPTTCEEQTMIKTDDGRLFHAPTKMWDKVK